MHNSVQPDVCIMSERPIGGDFWLFTSRESEVEVTLVVPHILVYGYPASFPTKGQVIEHNT